MVGYRTDARLRDGSLQDGERDDSDERLPRQSERRERAAPARRRGPDLAKEATHSGEFLGIAPTGKRIEIRYMDFWKVVDGKIVDNWVNVDFAHVAAQLGVDLFNGQGWEAYDRGEKTAPRPDQKGE